MPFDITEEVLTAGHERYPALLVTPKRPMVLGRARLEALRKASSLNETDRRLIEETRQRGARVHIAVFRGIDVSGAAGWKIDAELSDHEALELGAVLTRALLPIHRRMLKNGIVFFLHTEWGARECTALRHGVHTVAAELARHPDRDATRQIDQWILKNLIFHFELPLARLLETVLPPHLRMIAARLPRIQEMVSRLPPEAVD